ncbi:MAG: exodeoxyribonuclease V subunit gamma [Thermodesulfobacteriota bacterium]
MALVFHSSNCLHSLARLFARDLAGSRPAPLERQQVVVQTSGMGQWLSLQLAGQQGICAGLDFFFPNRLVARLLAPFIAPGHELPGQEELRWRIMALLPELCASRQAFGPVAAYLEDDEQGIKLFRLATSLADLFDQYQIYRPDMILAWQGGQDWFNSAPYQGAANLRWQQELWQALGLEQSRATIWRDFLALANSPQGLAPALLPRHLAIFGLSVLPPFHLQILQAVAHATAVHFYHLTPCREYWGFIKNRGEMRRAERYSGRPATELLLAEVNPLLASQGVLGRDFLNQLLNLEEEFQQEEFFVEPAGTSHLQLLQADLLDLREPEELAEGWRVDDHSLAFHSCHSPLREVEVLHDQLLWYMAEYGLAPEEILVMCPDLPTYGPLLRAVWGDEEQIPFSIADLPTPGLARLMDLFLALLELFSGRWSVSDLMGLLEHEVVARSFGLAPAEVAQVGQWLAKGGVHWGLDEEMVAALHGPSQVSWQAGEERFLLGYAMAADKGRDVAGIFPLTDFSEEGGELLGLVSDILAALRAFQARMSGSHPLAQWQEIMAELLNTFFYGGEPFADHVLALDTLIREPVAAGGSPLSLALVRAWLAERFAASRHALGFMAGGVTCSAMLPLRSIPFRLICLLGMNDGAFPRQDQRLDYDLSQVERRLGDRSSKENDRYLFLETLISARQFLYISYCGQSLADNSSLPPAVLVAELLDYLRRRFSLSEEELQDLVLLHRLQPFHPSYFQGRPGWPGFSATMCQAARKWGEQAQPAAPFVAAPLALAAGEEREVDLRQLRRFFRHPLRYLYNQGLGISLTAEDEELQDHEPFALQGLAAYQLRSELLAQGEAGLASLLAAAKGVGHLPDGNPGRWLAQEMEGEMTAFFHWLAPWQEEPLADQDLALELAGFKLTARLTGLYQEQQLYCCPAPLGARLVKGRVQVDRYQDLLGAWLAHLCLCLTDRGGQKRQTIVAGLDRTALVFRPVADAAAILAALLELFAQGQQLPLAFFPKYSLGLAAGQNPATLARVWQEDEYNGAGDPYHSHAGANLQGVEFPRLAREIGAPLFAHLELVSP